jgi:hypothetical protein
VDPVYYGNQRQLEYDFVVAPGADPRQIRLAFETVGEPGQDGLQARIDDVPIEHGQVDAGKGDWDRAMDVDWAESANPHI